MTKTYCDICGAPGQNRFQSPRKRGEIGVVVCTTRSGNLSNIFKGADLCQNCLWWFLEGLNPDSPKRPKRQKR